MLNNVTIDYSRTDIETRAMQDMATPLLKGIFFEGSSVHYMKDLKQFMNTKTLQKGQA